MPTIQTLLVFTGAALLMNFSPGPSNFYIISRSVAEGRSAGALAAIGLALGSLVHVLATAFGIGALFAVSPFAYVALKLLGAAYLVYLGIRYWLVPDDATPTAAESGRMTHGAVLRQSALVEITNPKTALFFLALLPQFVDVSRGPPAPQLLLLGVIVTLTAVPCDLLVAHFAARAGEWMRRNEHARRWQARVSGSILVGLGTWVALEARADG